MGEAPAPGDASTQGKSNGFQIKPSREKIILSLRSPLDFEHQAMQNLFKKKNKSLLQASASSKTLAYPGICRLEAGKGDSKSKGKEGKRQAKVSHPQPPSTTLGKGLSNEGKEFGKSAEIATKTIGSQKKTRIKVFAVRENQTKPSKA